jgi:S1-C subfamily serine protease
MAKVVLPQMMQYGRVQRGFLGIQARVVPLPVAVRRQFGLEQSEGVEVTGVESNGPADDAGIQEADVIVTLGERPATSVDDLHKLLTELPVGIPAGIVLLRDGRRLERMVIPADYPIPA